MHQKIQIRDHFRESLCRGKLGVGHTFVDAEHASKGIFHRTCDPLQLMGLHLADVDDAVGRQHFVAQHEMICRSSRKIHLRPVLEISQGDPQVICCLFDAAFLSHFFHFDHGIARRISVFQIGISRFL